MAYSPDSFTALEIPTLAKMNKLWANDASFNDGTGIANSAITSGKIATNAILGEKLAANAIRLGYTVISTAINQSGSTPTTIASVTVNVPAGGRDLLLLLSASQILPSDVVTRTAIDFMEGSTVLRRFYHNCTGSGETFMYVVPAPTAGSHTYFIRSTRDTGSGTVGWYADSTSNPAKTELTALLI